MKGKAFGLDIGATTMKLVALNQSKGGYLLSAVISTPTPPKGMLSESPLDQEEMARAIRAAVTQAKIQTPYVNIALPENQVYTRVIEMPVLSDKELSSAIFWEAEQYIPVPLTSVTLDWKVLKRPENPSEQAKMQVLMVGAPTLLVSKYEKILSLAGFIPTVIETEILSTLRALIVGDNFPNTLVVNIGAVSTSLAIVREGIIVFAYSIPTGGQAISRAIASDFGFSIDQAEEYKKVYGVSQEVLNGKIGIATTPILMSIIGEVKKALAFYNEKYKDETKVQQILLAGGTAKLPGISIFFAQNSGVETALANPWHALSSQQIPKTILDSASDYTVAVGLAMRSYE